MEAELGHVGDGIVSGVIKEDGNYDNPEDYLTNPEEMKRFIAETGVDCLKATRVAIKHEGKNVVRIAKKSGEEIK